MTITVAIKCSDGIVVACDSMLSVGQAQQLGQKVHVLSGAQEQLFAFAGDLGLADRFKAVASANVGLLGRLDKFQYAMNIAMLTAQNFQQTGIVPLNNQLATFLAFTKDNQAEVCLFGHGTQPRFLDQHHYACAIGSGDVAANPFLKFLEETLFQNQQPNIAEGKLLAMWAVKYAIQTMAGGVGEPIDMATVNKDTHGAWQITELTQDNIQEIRQAIQTGCEALRTWKTALGGEQEAEDIPEPPAIALAARDVA